MCVQWTKSVADTANFAALRMLPEITVPKLMAEIYDIFNIALCYIVGRNIGMNDILIDYVMCGVTGGYYSPWKTWEDKLKNYLLHTVGSFINDNITLYLIYSQYISTKGVGSNIINNYHYTNNDRKCHQDFDLHFRNDDYLTNKATAAISTIISKVYKGNRRNFTLETYYTITSKTFNNLAAAGLDYALNNKKK